MGTRLTQFAESERENVLLLFCVPIIASIYILVFRSVFTLVEKMIKKVVCINLNEEG